MPSKTATKAPIIPHLLSQLMDFAHLGFPDMGKIISCLVLLVANVGVLPSILGQTATSESVGFTTTPLLAGSDTFISIPFTRLPEFTGTVRSIAGNVITVAGTPGWTPNQFVYVSGQQPKTYFVLIGAGPTAAPAQSVATTRKNQTPVSGIRGQLKINESDRTQTMSLFSQQGHSYLVTANGPDTLAVNPGSGSLAGIAAGTRVMVIPYWTLATIFPPSDAGISFTPTTSTSDYKTQILVPDNTAAGTSLPVTTCFFSNNVDGTPNNIGWRVVGSNTTDRGDDPLLPTGYLVVRNLNGSPTLALKGIGAVLTEKFATPLRTLTTQAQDNAVAMIRPIDVTLKQTGLSPNDGSFVATAPLGELGGKTGLSSNDGSFMAKPPAGELAGQEFTVKDQLLLFDNSVAAINKQPSAVYYYSAEEGDLGGWRLFGDPLAADRGNDIIPAGSAMLIRKAKTASRTTVFWLNTATY